ncbi:hypothetical protein L1887_25254 [Cichorium endivia]|nr:hypothetical protein L1887_25254 [Cichorium endivia]
MLRNGRLMDLGERKRQRGRNREKDRNGGNDSGVSFIECASVSRRTRNRNEVFEAKLRQECALNVVHVIEEDKNRSCEEGEERRIQTEAAAVEK